MKKLLQGLFLSLTALSFCQIALAQSKKGHQKIIIIMMDGFGNDYYRSSDMPTLNKMEKQGLYKVVPSLMPSITNVNNASIITGTTPDVNGITGNVFLDPNTSEEEYMENSDLTLAETVFQRAQKAGLKSILFSCKTKTVTLLNKGAGEAVSRETVTPEWTKRLGTPPDIYSSDINYWMMEAALYSLKHKPEINLTYIHTTDYPMHMWAPESMESKKHLHKIDEYLSKLIKAAPDAAILITADHNVKHKSKCWDLEKALATCGVPIKAAISPEKDRYFKHHRGLGGSEYIYLNDIKDSSKVKHILLGFKGVEEVLTKEEAANRFHLMPERIGDLMVLGDSITVFGHLDKGEGEDLPSTYRSHGSLYEAHVPLFVYNAKNAPQLSYFTENYKLASWLYPVKKDEVKLIKVLPSSTLDGIKTVHGPHIAMYNPSKANRHKLIFMITGTGTSAFEARQVDSCFAQMGYHAVSIDYINNINSISCKNSSDSTSFDRFREEIVTGHQVSELTEVDSLNSIISRFRSLLSYLTTTDPNGKWDEFLNNGNPVWENIILAGHSQGSGNAAFLSKLVKVDRVILFAGPQDYLAKFARPAGWLTWKGKTPSTRYLSLLNINDPFNSANQIANDSKLMNLADANTLFVKPGQQITGNHRIFVTDIIPPTGISPHSSMLNPIFYPIWEQMLNAPLLKN